MSAITLLAFLISLCALIIHIKLIKKCGRKNMADNICVAIASALSIFGIIGHVLVYHNLWCYKSYDIDYIPLTMSIYYIVMVTGAFVTYKK